MSIGTVPKLCLDIADRLASGDLSPADGGMAILKLVHDESLKASLSMAEAIMKRHKEKAEKPTAHVEPDWETVP